MNTEESPSQDAAERRQAQLQEASRRLAAQAVGLTVLLGAQAALKLLLDTALALALQALPAADVSAFLRETADGVDAMKPRTVQ